MLKMAFLKYMGSFINCREIYQHLTFITLLMATCFGSDYNNWNPKTKISVCLSVWVCIAHTSITWLKEVIISSKNSPNRIQTEGNTRCYNVFVSDLPFEKLHERSPVCKTCSSDPDVLLQSQILHLMQNSVNAGFNLDIQRFDEGLELLSPVPLLSWIWVQSIPKIIYKSMYILQSHFYFKLYCHIRKFHTVTFVLSVWIITCVLK